jgi:hypothetical protein
MFASVYWKGTSSQSQNDGFPPSQNRVRPRPRSDKTLQQSDRDAAFDNSDQEVEQVVLAKDSKRPSRAGSSTSQPKRKTTTSTRPQHQGQPLFLDSDEEMQAKESDGRSQAKDETLTLQSSETRTQPSKNSSRKTKSSKAAAIIVDDDSDDGATFKGFRQKKRSTRT